MSTGSVESEVYRMPSQISETDGTVATRTDSQLAPTLGCTALALAELWGGKQILDALPHYVAFQLPTAVLAGGIGCILLAPAVHLAKTSAVAWAQTFRAQHIDAEAPFMVE